MRDDEEIRQVGPDDEGKRIQAFRLLISAIASSVRPKTIR
jgi:hypothetical protein